MNMATNWPALLVVVGIVIAGGVALEVAHHSATLDADVAISDTMCVGGEINSVELWIALKGETARTIAFHSWDQRRHVRHGWLVENETRTIEVGPDELFAISIAAPTASARISNQSQAQIMLNDGQKRAYVHFESERCRQSARHASEKVTQAA